MQLPKNSAVNNKRQSIMAYNRFSRANYPSNTGWDLPTTKVPDYEYEQRRPAPSDTNQGYDYDNAYSQPRRAPVVRYDDDVKV